MKKLISITYLLSLIFSLQAQFIFTESGQNLGNGSSNDIALGDLDNDGDLDAFVINGEWNAEEVNEVWFNDGNGNFTASEQVFENSKSGEVDLADLDGDGDLDAFIAYYYYEGGEPNEVWFNDGNGTFTDSGQRLGNRNGGVALADLDNDGDIDAFICNHVFANGTAGGLKIWLNDSTGYFTDSGQDLGNGNHTGVSLGDVDGDGDTDAFITFNYGSAGNRIWLNDSNGNFSQGQLVSMTLSNDAKLFDLDGDEDLDIFITHSGGNKIWLNDGKGNFTDSGQTLGSSQTSAVGLEDFDNDGDLDAFVLRAVYQGPRTNEIWMNDGSGTFTDTGLRTGTDESYDVELGDLDNDGDADAFVAITGANKVWLNNTINYFGQTPPGKTPKKFAPSFISLENRHEFNPLFSPDGTEFYFTISNPPSWSYSKTMVSKFVNNEWTEPSEIDFGGSSFDWGHCFSPDGNTLYFNSSNADWILDIWYVQRTDTGWSSANKLSETINSIGSEIACSINKDSVLYFRSNGEGNEDIYYSEKHNGTYDSYVRMELPVNTDEPEFNPIIRNGDSCLIFTKKRAANIYNRDIYITFKNSSNEWTNPRILVHDATSGSITPDNKYLLYNAGTADMDIYWVELDSLIESVLTDPEQTSIRPAFLNISIFPNPATQSIQIKSDAFSFDKSNYRIVNMDGIVVKQGLLEYETIDISELPRGIYMLVLQTNEGVGTKKIVVE